MSEQAIQDIEEATQPDRELARFTTILKVEPHPNADRLEIVTVYGWKVVAQKGLYKEGDRTVFFEIDSVCPRTKTFGFLADKNFKVKTVKLRGQISQGLCVPPIELANDPDIPGFQYDDSILKWVYGPDEVVCYPETDLTQALGVTKYVKALPPGMQGTAKGSFPHFIPKTDQIRCQNVCKEIAASYASGEEFEVTTKLDGQSFTAYYKDGQLGACSRNLELDLDLCKNAMTETFQTSGLATALTEYGKNIAVQCEFMGPGIQGNREQLKQHNLYVYDIFDIDEQRYLSPTERLDTFTILRNRPSTFAGVPIVDFRYKLPSPDVDELLAFAEGPSINHPVREGLVFKSHTSTFSFKCISNAFLLKEKD